MKDPYFYISPEQTKCLEKRILNSIKFNQINAFWARKEGGVLSPWHCNICDTFLVTLLWRTDTPSSFFLFFLSYPIKIRPASHLMFCIPFVFVLVLRTKLHTHRGIIL